MAEEQQPAPQAAQMGFNIEKIYVKDLSVEVPNAPAAFLEREAPQMDVQLHTQGISIGEEMYQVAITATVTAKVQDKTLFLVEVTQAGIFRIQGVPQEQMAMVLGIGCPNIVFPYLRETISDVVIRAGFPPLLLNPVNFEALYMQQQQQQAAQQPAGATH
jgi:preprotein translocase subunit SecB